MKLKWLGHSCFAVSHEGYTIVLDPYKPGSVPGLPALDLEADRVLCSHGHPDHCWEKAVRIVRSGAASPFSVQVIDSWHDDRDGALRGPNKIHILEADGIRVAHLGDLGAIFDLEQLAAIGRVDAVMCPVGGFYTIDAKTAAAELALLNSGPVVPMHYRGEGFGFDALAPVTDFTKLYDPALVRFSDSDSLEVEKGAARSIVVLKCPVLR